MPHTLPKTYWKSIHFSQCPASSVKISDKVGRTWDLVVAVHHSRRLGLKYIAFLASIFTTFKGKIRGGVAMISKKRRRRGRLTSHIRIYCNTYYNKINGRFEAKGGTRWNKQEGEDKVRNKEQIRGLRVSSAGIEQSL